MTYDARDTETIRETPTEYLQEQLDNPALGDVDVLGAIVTATVQTLAEQQEESLERISNQAYLDTATGRQLTRKARELGVERRNAVRATGVVEFTSNNPVSSNVTIPAGTEVQTSDGSVGFETTKTATILGPQTKKDTTNYTESVTSYTVVTSHDIDVRYRDSITVAVDHKTDDANHSSDVKVVDTTNSTDILTDSTTNTSFTTAESTYDVSGISDTITVEYRVKVQDTSATATVTDALVETDGQTGVKTNVRAVDGGTDGNLTKDRLTSLTTSLSAVDSVTNPNPTGDEDYTDIDGNTLVVGQDREDDEELRDRAFRSTSIGGAATIGAIETAVLDVDSVRSVSVFANPTDSTDANGLPPYSNEVVVSGGDDQRIAETLRDTVAVTELYRLQSGIIGNGVTKTLFVDALDENVDVDFSRPVAVNIEIDVEIVTTDTYVGDEELKDAVVDYIGGTASDGSSVTGLGAGKNVIQDRVEDTIVGEDMGIEGVVSITLDTNGDGSDDTTTNSAGISVIDIKTEEQAFVDADDITITEA